MGQTKTSGLRKRHGKWHIDKRIYGCRICESTQTSNRTEAEKYLVKRIEEIRQTVVYGVRPKRTFRQAVTKYLQEHHVKDSLNDDIYAIRCVDPYIGNLPLEAIHMGSLQEYIDARRAEGVKNRTINAGLQVVRHILNLAAGTWLDSKGVTWLANAPKINLLPEYDKRKPYPLNWVEQDKLLAALPVHLKKMALFSINTGCRDREVCRLRWEWEVRIPELGTSVFIIPGYRAEAGSAKRNVKNGEDKVIVLNKEAARVVDSVRGQHHEYVFTYRGQPLYRMGTNSWKKARVKVGLSHVRIHDLRHTFGRRLRSAGVSFEDRQDLLGHKSGRITTHYSAAELDNLLAAANKACDRRNGPALVLLRSSEWAKPMRKAG